MENNERKPELYIYLYRNKNDKLYWCTKFNGKYYFVRSKYIHITDFTPIVSKNGTTGIRYYGDFAIVSDTHIIIGTDVNNK